MCILNIYIFIYTHIHIYNTVRATQKCMHVWDCMAVAWEEHLRVKVHGVFFEVSNWQATGHVQKSWDKGALHKETAKITFYTS